MKLSRRLETIIGFVPKQSSVADIGSDHGYVIKELITRGIANKCFGVENKKGPFENLKKNVEAFSNISISLSDGINQLSNDYNVVIIAGMGFDNIQNIINAHLEKLEFIEYFIIDSHTLTESLRKFIVSLGFLIDEETSVYENGIYYEIIRFKKGVGTYTDLEYKYGPIILKQKNSDFVEYYQSEANRLRNLVALKMISPLRKREIAAKICELEGIIYENN